MKFIFQRIARNHSLAMALLCLTLIGALCNVGFGLLIKFTIDTLNQASEELSDLMLFSALFVVVRFLTPMVHGAKEFICSKLVDEEEARLHHEAFKALHNADHDYQVTKNTGDVIRRIQIGLGAFKTITRAVFLNVLPVALDVLLIVGIVTWFFGLGYAAIITAFIGAYLWVVFYFTNRRMPYLKAVSDTDRALAAFTHDSYLNQESVKLFTPLSHEWARHRQFLDDSLSAQRRSRRNLYQLTILTSIISGLGCLLILVWSSVSITQQAMTIGSYLMLVTYLFQVFLPLNSLGLSFRQIKKGIYDTAQLHEVLTITSGETGRSESLSLSSSTPVIVEFLNLSLVARDGGKIFSGLSGTMPLRGITFLTGKSGVGKSSLIRMLCGLIRPTGGQLRINGVDCNALSRDAIRNNIAIASQDVVLFNMTLKHNLLVANPNAKDETLVAALQQVGLGYLLDEGRGGLHAPVGERGQKLSGGEKQRIGLARALLKNAPLIILDEPTSALDSDSSKTIRTVMEEVSCNARLLVITHDFSLIKEESDDVYKLTPNGFAVIAPNKHSNPAVG